MTSKSNRIVHGMWFGTQLSRLELLTVHSFLHHGHEFHLWAYDDLSRAGLPAAVRLRDANRIIPRQQVFAKAGRDRETGVGRGSFGAPFSDLFRYKLLLEHGGIWVDMDVTCLRPFDFRHAYAFRPHRLGVVGSIMKCPKGSALMRDVYRETAATVNRDSDYLAPNRILSRHVAARAMLRYVVPDMSNSDSWPRYIRPLTERRVAIPQEWYAIHWINELWRTFQADAGHYRGRKVLDDVPDKNFPREGSTQWELYRKYGLIDARAASGEHFQPLARLGKAPVPQPIVRMRERASQPGTLNIVVPDLARDGVERIVTEVAGTLRQSPGQSVRIYVSRPSRQQSPLASTQNLQIVYGESEDDAATTMRTVGLHILRSGSSLAYTHGIPSRNLQQLWQRGISTIPVIHDPEPGWLDPVGALDVPYVPCLVATADAIAAQLRARGCSRPIVTIRHELQRTYVPAQLAQQRQELRDRYGIGNETLLVGMIGNFNAHKAYTRAVRVLQRLQQRCASKLMIVGAWDAALGGSRAAYEAACRLALDLGVIAELLCVGRVDTVEPYLAAFDVFLNTSVYEGLSVAMLEAAQSGCPIVAADAGGNAELAPGAAVLVEGGLDIDAYVEAIIGATASAQRYVPTPPREPDLVPQLWALLARFGSGVHGTRGLAGAGTLFVTRDLALDAANSDLIDLLSGLAALENVSLCTLQERIHASYQGALDAAQVQIFSAQAATLAETTRLLLLCVEWLNVRSICFWNASPDLKFMVAKVLTGRPVRIYDASPGTLALHALYASDPLQRRMAYTAQQYLARLDGLILAPAPGPLPEELRAHEGRIHWIASGVPPAPTFIPLPPAQHLLPPEWDPDFSVGSVNPITPDSRLEWLLDMIRHLGARLPGASLTLLGDAAASDSEYHSRVRAQGALPASGNVWWLGATADTLSYLATMRVFVTASRDDGCARTLLQAMSVATPVVAFSTPTTVALLDDGVTGFLVDSPEQMAECVYALLTRKRLRRRIGNAARRKSRGALSLGRRVDAYARLLAG